VSVVIPALNEEANLPLVLEGLPPVYEVIVVDGGSADDTVAVAREVRPDAVVLRQTRAGKGNALVCGFEACTGDIVVTLNADGTTDPGELPRYVDALLAGAEVAHGSRYRHGGDNLDEHRLDRLGNRTLNGIVNTLFGTRFTDLGYGYNAYWRTLLPLLDLPGARLPGRPATAPAWGDGPEIEPLINIRAAAQGLRVVEVASVGYPRIHGRGRRQFAHESVRALRTTLTEYLRRWQIARQPDRPLPLGARHGATTGVGRGSRRALPTRETIPSFESFLPPEPQSTGRHAAHRAAPGDDQQRPHRYADGPVARSGGLAPAPDAGQEPRWNRPAEPVIDQRAWRDTYTDPDAVVPGVPRQRGEVRPDERRAGADRRGAAERRSEQHWRTSGRPRPAWHATIDPVNPRPELTVIAGEGRPWAGGRTDPPGTTHLRAVPGEPYGGPAHRA
jgi:hypothetical protein